MLHHDHGVADIAQLQKDTNESLGIFWMQSDARLVQDVGTSYQDCCPDRCSRQCAAILRHLAFCWIDPV